MGRYVGEGFKRGPLVVMASWAFGGLLFWLAGGPLAKAAALVDDSLADLGSVDD